MASSKSFPQFDTASVEDTVKRIQEMNERMIESSKSDSGARRGPLLGLTNLM